ATVSASAPTQRFWHARTDNPLRCRPRRACAGLATRACRCPASREHTNVVGAVSSAHRTSRPRLAGAREEGGTMRRAIRTLSALFAAALLCSGPAGAIVNGQLDGTRHPEVGALIAEFRQA